MRMRPWRSSSASKALRVEQAAETAAFGGCGGCCGELVGHMLEGCLGKDPKAAFRRRGDDSGVVRKVSAVLRRDGDSSPVVQRVFEATAKCHSDVNPLSSLAFMGVDSASQPSRRRDWRATNRIMAGEGVSPISPHSAPSNTTASELSRAYTIIFHFSLNFLMPHPSTAAILTVSDAGAAGRARGHLRRRDPRAAGKRRLHCRQVRDRPRRPKRSRRGSASGPTGAKWG